MLGTTVPAGSKIKLQKDAANTANYAIDFINLEQVAPIANPDPAKYAVPAGFTQQDVQNALDKARHGHHRQAVGVYLPAGDYQTVDKFQVYGKAVKVVGAGPWYTRFHAPPTQENTDVGFRAESTGERLDVRELRLLRQLHLADRRPGQGVRLRQRRRTSPSTTSGSSTWSACTGAPTPTT